MVPTTADLYFDSVSRVRVPSWSRGRVTLLGDAAAGVSLFGDGSVSAIVGAATLASHLSVDRPTEPAWLEYERVHRQVVAPKARRVRWASHLLVPASRPGIALRNAASRFIRS